MPISVVGTANAFTVNGTSVTVAIPATQAGDIIVVAHGANPSSGTSSSFPPVPAGYTQASRELRLVVSYRAVSSAEAAHNLTLTNPQTCDNAAVVAVYRGATFASAGAQILNNTDGVNYTIPGSDFTATGRVVSLASGFILNDFATHGTVPAGWTRQATTPSASALECVVALLDMPVVGSGNSGAFSSSWTKTATTHNSGNVVLAAIPSPPTAPGAFTTPTSGERVTTTDLVAWGASADADGDPITYTADLSLNNGATYTNRYSGTATSFTFDYSAQAATATAKWRVRATAAGDTTAYTYSPTFTVNKAPTAPGAFTSPASGSTVDTTGTVTAGAANDVNGDALTYEWDLSLDNGATWTRKRNLIAGTSWTYNYEFDAATTAAKWRVRAHDGAAYGPFRESTLFAIYHNQAPTAPTPTDPAGGVTKDRTKTITLRATYNDPDPGDTVSESSWRYRVVGAPTWTTQVQAGNLREYAIPAGALAAGNYEWQALYKDAKGVASPWSASEFFTAATPPPGPSITSPVDGATVPMHTVVAWTSTDQAKYQVRRVADVAGAPDEATVYYDSGWIVGADARNHPLDFLTNNRYEHVQVRVESAGLLISVWATVRVLASYTEPAVPSVVVQPEPGEAQMRLLITNPTPVAPEPEVAEVRVWRREVGGLEERIAVGLAPGAVYLDRTPAHDGREYEYQIEAVGVNDATSVSPWTP